MIVLFSGPFFGYCTVLLFNNQHLIMSTTQLDTNVSKQLNDSVSNLLSQKDIDGFEKAFMIATATKELKSLLSDEYMAPIMELQGSRLGFRTDKDREEGYSVSVVRDCLIEAVLMGVQPFGNQFNIIAGNTYITKEGFGHKLANYEALSYTIVPNLPRINKDKTSAAISMDIEWSIDGSPTKKMTMEIPIKMNSRMGTDAVIGKATRKARSWLYYTITGSEIGGGEVEMMEGAEPSHTTIEIIPNVEKAERLKGRMLQALTDNLNKDMFRETFLKEVNELGNLECQNVYDNRMNS